MMQIQWFSCLQHIHKVVHLRHMAKTYLKISLPKPRMTFHNAEFKAISQALAHDQANPHVNISRERLNDYFASCSWKFEWELQENFKTIIPVKNWLLQICHAVTNAFRIAGSCGKSFQFIGSTLNDFEIVVNCFSFLGIGNWQEHNPCTYTLHYLTTGAIL